MRFGFVERVPSLSHGTRTDHKRVAMIDFQIMLLQFFSRTEKTNMKSVSRAHGIHKKGNYSTVLSGDTKFSPMSRSEGRALLFMSSHHFLASKHRRMEKEAEKKKKQQ